MSDQVVNGHALVVFRLAIWGWDPSRPARRTGRTPLHMACERPGPFPPVARGRRGGGDVELMAGLLRLGADPARPDADGRPPLVLAAQAARDAVFSSELRLGAECELLPPNASNPVVNFLLLHLNFVYREPLSNRKMTYSSSIGPRL
jgi:hypothetical protein